MFPPGYKPLFGSGSKYGNKDNITCCCRAMEAGLRTRYPPPSDRECGPLFSRDLIWEGGDVRGHTPLRGALAARAAEVASRLREGPTGEEGLRRVVALMSSITNTASLSAESAAAVPPDVADGVFDGSAASRLLRDTLAACDADAASGAQHWIGVSRGHGASPRTRPAARLLGSAAAVPAAPPAVKPFDYGLYTSTPLAAGYGLWRVYLDQYYGSDLFPLPWYTWRLTVPATATVATIDDARVGPLDGVLPTGPRRPGLPGLGGGRGAL